ncbi:MAG: DNA topoisomerase, partial [Pseudomonadota bacterium]
FTTSKLQQEAANKLVFSAKKTMTLAQKLYEGVNTTKFGMAGLITYMRTDSVRTDPEALTNLREYITKEYGKQFLSNELVIYTKKGTNKVQDAHEAIRPSSLEYNPDDVKNDLDPDEFKLYNLIWNKFVASQMAPAVMDQTAAILEANKHFFKANGSQIKFAGFRTVYLEDLEKYSKKKDKDEEEEDENSTILPPLKKSENLKPVEIPSMLEHWTNPPPRYGEAMLVKELEEKGIGRPSTYAAIISNIQDRGYVDKIEGRFMPSELGIMVCRMLVESFPEIMDVDFTAGMEDLLDKIEEGEVAWKKVLKEFWAPFEKTLEKAKEEMKNIKKQSIPSGLKCIKCKTGDYMIKWGRNGQFLACSNYPDCNSTQDFKKHVDGSIEIIPKQYAKGKCPACAARLVVKKGRYGRFVTCENYPICKTTLPYMLEEHCPRCKTGNFTEKTSRYGKLFYGCSNYPNCNNAMWARPVAIDCPQCGYPVMGLRQTKKGNMLECPGCKHKMPAPEQPTQPTGLQKASSQ